MTRACGLRAADPCGGLLRPWSPEHPDPTTPLLAGLSDEQRPGAEDYCAEVNRGRPGCNTPLVVAFDGEGITFASEASAPGFAFRSGSPTATDWPTATTPWLALDRDGDGAITSGAELFGDATGAHDGFAAP